MACASSNNQVPKENNASFGYVVIVVLYILLAIIIGSWLWY